MPNRFLFLGLAILFIGLLVSSLLKVRDSDNAAWAIKDDRNAEPVAQITLPVSLPNFTKPVKQAEANGLHNVYSLSPTFYCGSEPEGNEGFLRLKQLGVTTIISVDGSLPNVELAEKNGIRYIHLPIGYDGVPRERIVEIATVISNGDLFGKVYLHCHHGKHRGPAAAVAAARCVDPHFSAEQADTLLKTIGTDPHYEGLYRDVRTAVPFDTREKSSTFQFQSKVQPNSLVERMVAIDVTMERIKLLAKAGWKVPADHPDLVPAHEALQLVEHYKEVERLKLPNETMNRHLKPAIDEAVQFEAALRKNEPREQIDAVFRNVSKRCASCHTETRDNK